MVQERMQVICNCDKPCYIYPSAGASIGSVKVVVQPMYYELFISVTDYKNIQGSVTYWKIFQKKVQEALKEVINNV